MGEVSRVLEFFGNLDATVQVALITLCGGVLVAVINGIVSLLNNRKKKDAQSQATVTDKSTVNQTLKGHNNTVIGIQNNIKENK